MTKAEFLENKYPIDKNYHEQMTTWDISQIETELEFYERSHSVTSNILKMHENDFIVQIKQGQCTTKDIMHILFIGIDFILFNTFEKNLCTYIISSSCSKFGNMYS